MMKRSIFSVLLGGCVLTVYAQQTLQDCQLAAQENYPLVRQYDLIRQAEAYTLSNVTKGNLPQINIGGKVSYQSEATTFPFEMPGTGIKGLPKDQYQVVMEVQQNVWDGGQIHHRKQQAVAEATEQERRLDVSMYALRERVNQVFFGILLLDEQLKQNELLNEQLSRNLKDVMHYEANGLANSADVDAVKVELLNVRQQRIHLEESRSAYLGMLSLLTGKELAPDERLVCPQPVKDVQKTPVNRPEMRWYEAQKMTVQATREGLKSGYLPKLSLFAQGGYGNPGLDMLRDEFRPFYMVGARLNWNFGSLYTLKNDKRKLDNRMQQIEAERDLFLFNTRLQVREQEGRLQTLERQMLEDEEIIRLRTHIRKAAEAKVASGTLSVTEMLREVTQEHQAMQTKAQHKIEWLMQQYQRKHLTN